MAGERIFFQPQLGSHDSFGLDAVAKGITISNLKQSISDGVWAGNGRDPKADTFFFVCPHYPGLIY
jgi:hypothetical protein